MDSLPEPVRRSDPGTTPAEKWATKRRQRREDRRQEVHELARELKNALRDEPEWSYDRPARIGSVVIEFGVDKLIQVLLRSV